MKFNIVTLVPLLVLVGCASSNKNVDGKKSARQVSVSKTYNTNKNEPAKNGDAKSVASAIAAYSSDDYRNDEDDETLFAEDSYQSSLATDLPEDRNTRGHIFGSSSHDSLRDSSGNTKKNVYFLYGAEHLNLKNYYFDIPVVYNDAVKKWMNYFLGRGKDYFIRYSERAGRYAPTLGKILEDHGMPRDLIFLAMAESGFQNNAKSWAKAVGPWQFMSFTGRRYGLKIDWFVDERRDPIKATIAAARYLQDLYELFGSWELSAAGYNAGEGKIGKAVRRYGSENFWDITKGRYLKPETKNYVPKIMALAIIGKNLEAFGLNEIEFHEPLDFEEIDVKPNSDIFEIAAALNVEVEEIQRLNPELSRWQTPVNVKNYKLRVPVGQRVAWNSCCKNQDFTATKYQKYEANGKTSLEKVAKNYRLRPQLLAALNGVSANSVLRDGDVIKLPFREGQSARDEMYGDLWEVSSKKSRRYLKFKQKLFATKKKESGKKQKISKTVITQFSTEGKRVYVVKKGETLWHVARKTGISVNKLRKSNLALLGGRDIKAGDKLVIK